MESSVRDVDSIGKFLTNTLPESAVGKITRLTASNKPDAVSRESPEHPESLPTFEKITSSFSRIVAEATDGDSVYIHFSGHGTRTEPTSEYSHKGTGDLALVLVCDDEPGTRYLRGLKLAHHLKEMAEKGLPVTLVLDCCFSGSVVRHDGTGHKAVRTVPYDRHVDFAHPQQLSLQPPSTGRVLRDAEALSRLLVRPDRCAFFAACGPHDLAREVAISAAGEKQGALSFLLIRSLSGVGVGASFS